MSHTLAHYETHGRGRPLDLIDHGTSLRGGRWLAKEGANISELLAEFLRAEGS